MFALVAGLSVWTQCLEAPGLEQSIFMNLYRPWSPKITVADAPSLFCSAGAGRGGEVQSANVLAVVSPSVDPEP